MIRGAPPVPALDTLRRLRWRAKRRDFIAGLKRPKRVAGLVLVLGLFGLILVGQMLSPKDRAFFAGEDGRMQLALFLTFFPFMSIYVATKQSVIAFRPEEVHFLFPAPLTSAQLLRYHVRSAIFKATTASLFFALFLRPHDIAIPHAFVVYVGLFAMTVLLQVWVDLKQIGRTQEARKTRSRIVGGLLLGWVVVTAGAAWIQDGGVISWQLLRHVSLPVRPFMELLRTSDPLGMLPWLALIGAVMFTLAASISRYSGDVREAARDASERTANTLERLQGGKMFQDAPKQHTGGRTLPLFPRWGGAGPHCWRQLNALRRSKKSFVALLFVAGIMGFTGSRAESLGPEVAALIMAIGIGAIGPIYVQCDFRSDFDSLAWMRSMPASPTAVAWGQILAPTLVLTALQLAVGGWGLFFLRGEQLLVGLAVLVALPLINMLQLIVWNGAFLLFPLRMLQHGGPPNVGKIVRIYLTIGAVFMVIGSSLGLATGLGVGTFFLLSWAGLESETPRALAGTLVGFTAVFAMVAWGISVLGVLYARLDPNRELI